MKGTSEEARTINSHLDSLIAKNSTIEKKLIAVEQEITAELFNNVLTGKAEENRTLVPIFQDHNNKIKELVGKEYAPGTLEHYTISLKHTIEFMQWKYNVSDIDIKKIDHAFITDYEFYLRSVRNCTNNTTVKYIKNFNKIIKLCLAKNWLDKNPYAN